MIGVPGPIIWGRRGAGPRPPGGPVTFKDLIRLLRRRWLTALLVWAAFFIGFMGVSMVTEHPQFRARTRILITTPPILLTATQGTQWISVTQMDPKTWVTLISGSQ